MGKVKGSKGKDDWNKGKGGKDRFEFSKGCGVAAGPTLLAVPQLASSSCEDVPGGLHAFDSGRVLSSAAELYFEVCGECSVHFAVPAPTKISAKDNEDFACSGPVQVAGRNFRNIQELKSEIVSLRRGHANPPRRLGPEAEKLMRGVFEYHPDAKEKLRDLQFIQVRSNPKSVNPHDVAFFVMSSEQDGDDISYVKCLRAMSQQMTSGKEGEQMLPLATVTIDRVHGLQVAKDPGSIGLQGDVSLGLRLDLERLLLSVHLAKEVLGPWHLRELEGYSTLPLLVVLDVPPAGCVVRWAAPFDLKDGQSQPTQPAVPAMDAGPEVRLAELKNNLEALMKEQDIPGNLSALSTEELQRIALQVLVKSLAVSLHVTRSGAACAMQNSSLLRIAHEQGIELTCYQLQETRAELQQVKAQRDAAEATLNQLREEMAALRKSTPHVEGEAVAAAAMTGAGPGQPSKALVGHRPQVAVAAEEVEQLSQELKRPLPEPAKTMLRNSLKLMSSEMYSGPPRALWELLQNADDCSYHEKPELLIERTGDDLWIQYNEQGFTSEDVKALCSLGSSTKGSGQTGEKGVGFKSAFVLSSRPHVLSNPYRFFFDENSPCPLPHVTPHLLDAGATLPRAVPQKGTAVYLPLRKDFPNLLDEIVPEALLFLHRLRCVTVESGHDVRRLELCHDGCHCKVQVTGSFTKEHEYLIARSHDLAVAFPLASPEGGLLMATLPIHRLEGLKTPLNGPFELTANREALRENSQHNVQVRDGLAELFLQAAGNHPILSSKVWQLQPDAALGGFWAPFVQRVRTGLQEAPLIPCRPCLPGANGAHWPLRQCRRPDSALLLELQLEPSDLEEIGLAIPTEEFLRQLPPESEFNLPDFDAKDLIGLLQCKAAGAWRHRHKVVGALLHRFGEVDLKTLRSVALFPVGDGDEWSACEDGHIYASLPSGAPKGLLKALHGPSACVADRELLKLLGSGNAATPRDVAFAIVQQALGLTELEDHRFSWTNLAYLGEHWVEILKSTATDDWLSKQSPTQMEDFLRGVLVPSCSGRLWRCAGELQCPFLLGCKSGAADRSKLVAEPPGANDIQARLWWELVFLRLGAHIAEDDQLHLPSNFFSEPGVGPALESLLNHYEQRGVLPQIKQKCFMNDLLGQWYHLGQLQGPAFQPMLGPDRVLDLSSEGVVPRCAERLGVTVKVTAKRVIQQLDKAAKGGQETLRRAYHFLSAEWRNYRLPTDSGAWRILESHGVWMLNREGELTLEQVSNVSWEDVQRQISLWPKDGLNGIFASFGIVPPPPAVVTSDPAAGPTASSQIPSQQTASSQTASSQTASSQMASGQTASSQMASSQTASSQSQRPPSSGSQPTTLTQPVLPQVRAGMQEDGVFREPNTPLTSLVKLLRQIFHSCNGEEVLYGKKPEKEMLASEIHFTQNSISEKFGHGHLKGCQVSDVISALRDGQMNASELPLVVVKFESKYFTLNNRSLFALQKASKAQKPLTAKVAAFEGLCPVTAKFLQLRCSSLEGQDEGQEPPPGKLKGNAGLGSEGKNGKMRLNEFLMRYNGNVKRGDLEFKSVPAPLAKLGTPLFVSTLSFHNLRGQLGEGMCFTGEPKPNKQDAEHSASDAALEYLTSLPGAPGAKQTARAHDDFLQAHGEDCES